MTFSFKVVEWGLHELGEGQNSNNVILFLPRAVSNPLICSSNHCLIQIFRKSVMDYWIILQLMCT